MPRQTFLSRESFVDATEKQTRETLSSLPAYISHIVLVAENPIIESYRFTYDKADKKLQYLIDVTILPLNDQYTRISLHASHTNGHAFYEDADMSFALHDFESAIHAALKGDLAYYKPAGHKPKEQSSLLMKWASFLFPSLIPGLKKKLS
jgi:hypothetical protein